MMLTGSPQTSPSATATPAAPTTPPSPLSPGNEAQLLAPDSAPAAHKSNPIVEFLKKAGEDIKEGVVDIGKFVRDLPRLIKVWNTLSPQVKAVAVQLFHDVMRIVQDAEAEAVDIKDLNIGGVITLTPETWAAIQQLRADADSGDEHLNASLKALGIDFTLPTNL